MGNILMMTSAQADLPPVEQVGGKARSLGAMARLGLPVPPGLVLTVDFFAAWNAELAASSEWAALRAADAEAGPALGVALRMRCAGLALTPEQRTEIAARLLGIIEGRCLSGHNGAEWQRAVVRRLEGRGLSRIAALGEMTAGYASRMHSNEPVHTWDLPS